MNIDYLLPINQSHSVKHVVFALEWQGELTDSALTDIENLAPKLKSHFPNMGKINVKEVPALANISASNQENNERVVQVMFERRGKAGNIISQLNVLPTKCFIIINEYSRWKQILEAVMRYFKILLPLIMKERSINIISLQYVDMFTWKDEPENLDLHKVFKKNTPYLAPNVFVQKGLWHCHHGYLIENLLGLDGTCLDNINVGMVNDQNDIAIQIQTTHQFTLNKPLRMATKDYLQSIEQVQNKLHDHNKDILNQLFTDEVCTKINLVNRGMQNGISS